MAKGQQRSTKEAKKPKKEKPKAGQVTATTFTTGMTKSAGAKDGKKK
jgi:hypothetical protein